MNAVSVIIFFAVIGVSPLWYKLCFNLLFWGYSFFDELRLAIVFYAVVSRIMLYPTRLLAFHNKNHEKFLEKRLQHAQKTITDPQEIKEKIKEIRKELNPAYNIILFNYVFLLMHTIVTGILLHQNFDKSLIERNLLPIVPEPSYPLNTISWLPFVGMADLKIPNHTQNIVTAIGTLLYGFFEIFAHKKYSKFDVLRYLFIFPTAAYLIAANVAAGFEFSVIVFQSLSVILFIIEVLTIRRNK